MSSGYLPVAGANPEQLQQSIAAPLNWTLAVYSSVGLAGIVLSFVVITVMSARKTQSPTTPGTFPKRSKKVRSISVSVDLECPENLRLEKSMSHSYYLRSRDQRYRAVSECVGPGPQSSSLPCKGHHFPALKFPFQNLPVDCKVKVFSFLGPMERGIAGQVCQDWNLLVKESRLWSSVDFTIFPLCHKHHLEPDCTKMCYTSYKKRMKKFMLYLKGIRPVLKRLRLAFDIGDPEDGWLDVLDDFFDAAHLKELEFLYFNWRETPGKPYWETANLTWSSSDAKDLMHKHRYRQRLFVNFFVNLTARAPSITKLIIPFEWSPRSLLGLSRLSRLDSLVLEKYFVFQSLSQDCIDQLFQSAPYLRNLILEVWTPSGPGLQFYSICSAALQYMDISQCRGFYLQSMHVPQLEVFKISRHPWNGPLISADSVSIPCIYQVLREGCPSLKQINEHVLRPGWQQVIYPELQVVFKSVCSCREHKSSGWTM